MVIIVKHTLSEFECLIRVQKMIEHSKKQYSIYITKYKETWNQNIGDIRFFANGICITSTIELKAEEISIKIKLPLIGIIFKGKIESEIRHVASKYFT